MRVNHTYLIRRKGGNLPGYSTLFSFVPQLALSMHVAWNGGQDEFGMSNILWDQLLPGFTQALAPYQPNPPTNPGPDYQELLGEYTTPGLEQPAHVVFNATGQDYLLLYVPDFVSVPLTWFEGTTYRNYIPPGLQSCLDSELLAFAYQYVYFIKNEQGQWTVSMPGWAPGFVLTKES